MPRVVLRHAPKRRRYPCRRPASRCEMGYLRGCSRRSTRPLWHAASPSVLLVGLSSPERPDTSCGYLHFGSGAEQSSTHRRRHRPGSCVEGCCLETGTRTASSPPLSPARGLSMAPRTVQPFRSAAGSSKRAARRSAAARTACDAVRTEQPSLVLAPHWPQGRQRPRPPRSPHCAGARSGAAAAAAGGGGRQRRRHGGRRGFALRRL